MERVVYSLEEMNSLATRIGASLKGGEVFELIGDVGTGKTAFTKGLAVGLGVTDDVQSPSFTISRVYKARDGLELHHYDLYRLAEPGIVKYDVAESVGDAKVVTVIEWGSTVEGILPEKTTRLYFHYGDTETERQLKLETTNQSLEEAYAVGTEK